MGRDDSCLVADIEIDQPAGCMLHDIPVGVAAHHDANDGLRHCVLPRGDGARLTNESEE